jgi:hypothetical protein
MIYMLMQDNCSVMRKPDCAIIPFDEANIDYQKYLAWVAEGNTAEEWIEE